MAPITKRWCGIYVGALRDTEKCGMVFYYMELASESVNPRHIKRIVGRLFYVGHVLSASMCCRAFEENAAGLIPKLDFVLHR